MSATILIAVGLTGRGAALYVARGASRGFLRFPAVLAWPFSGRQASQQQRFLKPYCSLAAILAWANRNNLETSYISFIKLLNLNLPSDIASFQELAARLIIRIEALEADNRQLRANVLALEADKRRLEAENRRLESENKELRARLNANSPAFADPSFPDYPDPDSIAVPKALPVTIPLRERYQYRHVTGRPWDGPRETAETGGWIRLAEPRPYDAAVVAALSDAWYPAVFTRLATPLGVPTVDLTVHIRSVEALARMKPDDWMAVRFRTTVAAEGFLEEDGELWAPDGTLVAHSRQLGLLLAE